MMLRRHLAESKPAQEEAGLAAADAAAEAAATSAAAAASPFADTGLDPLPARYQPRRFGLKFDPPTVVLEFMDTNTGKLYLQKVRVPDLNSPGDAEEIARHAHNIKRKFSKHISPADIADGQIEKLVRKLSMTVQPTSASGDGDDGEAHDRDGVEAKVEGRGTAAAAGGAGGPGAAAAGGMGGDGDGEVKRGEVVGAVDGGEDSSEAKVPSVAQEEARVVVGAGGGEVGGETGREEEAGVDLGEVVGGSGGGVVGGGGDTGSFEDDSEEGAPLSEDRLSTPTDDDGSGGEFSGGDGRESDISVDDLLAELDAMDGTEQLGGGSTEGGRNIYEGGAVGTTSSADGTSAATAAAAAAAAAERHAERGEPNADGTFGDLNRVSEVALQNAKEVMNVEFEKNRVKPGDASYEYEKSADFGDGIDDNSWD
jgi:hypothetical protein